MVSNHPPFSTPKALDVVTDRFVAFCAELSLTILSSAVVRHWCWEWSASQRGDLNRYLTLLSWEDYGRTKLYQSEFWAEADNDALFTRRRVTRLRFSDRGVRAAVFVAKLDAALASTWRSAQGFTKSELTHAFTEEGGPPAFVESVPSELWEVAHEGRERAIPRVLIVDDDPVMRQAVRRILQKGPRPIEVDEAKDGLEALQRTEVHRPDLLVLDLTMPNMDGFTLLKRIRADPSLASLPIMLLTDEAVSPSEAELLGIVADGYISKPIEWDKVTERVDQLLRRPRRALARRRRS